jgi:hypothetical protein
VSAKEEETPMKTQEFTKAAAVEPRPYASAARPSTPGAMTKAEPADVERAESEQTQDAGAKLRRLRWIVGLYVAIATVSVAMGDALDSIFWASIALFFALLAQPSERVPKLLRYFSIAALVMLGIVKTVLWILKTRGL